MYLLKKKMAGVILNIVLILMICFKMPKESMGASNVSSSSERLLNILIAVLIVLYFVIAFKLNLENN